MPYFTRFNALTGGEKPGVYPGVLVIETGPAKGHFAVKDGNRVVNYDPGNPEHSKLQKYQICIEPETLADVAQCGLEAGKVKCKLNHGEDIRDIVGNYSAFRVEGNQVRADLALMGSTPHRAYVEELIANYAEKIGNSIDFNYFYEIKGDKAVARCVKLNSVDLVDTPAATNSLFQQPNQNTPADYMPLSAEDLAAIGNAVKSEVSNQLGALKTEFNTRFEEISKKMEEETEDEEKKEKKESEGTEKMAALVEKATLSAVQKILPKAAIESLSSLGNQSQIKDEYAEKLQLCKGAGMTDAQAARHIARAFPHIYNAKFGAPTTTRATI